MIMASIQFKTQLAFVALASLGLGSSGTAHAHWLEYIRTPGSGAPNVQVNNQIHVDNKVEVYFDTRPIQDGLKKLAEAQRESFGTDYIERLAKRYPELKKFEKEIGVKLDSAWSTEFIRDYGRGAFEREIETRLTSLYEIKYVHPVIAANLGRALRGEPALSKKQLANWKESTYPLNSENLMQLLRSCQGQDAGSCSKKIEHTTIEIFEKQALEKLTINEKRYLRDYVIRALQSLPDRVLGRGAIPYGDLPSRMDEVLAQGSDWHGAIDDSLKVGLVNINENNNPEESKQACDRLASGELYSPRQASRQYGYFQYGGPRMRTLYFSSDKATFYCIQEKQEALRVLAKALNKKDPNEAKEAVLAAGTALAAANGAKMSNGLAPADADPRSSTEISKPDHVAPASLTADKTPRAHEAK
jgi:hypothetical protein